MGGMVRSGGKTENGKAEKRKNGKAENRAMGVMTTWFETSESRRYFFDRQDDEAAEASSIAKARNLEKR